MPALIAIPVLLLLVPVVAQKPAQKNLPPMPVVLSEVKKQELQEKRWYTGTILSLRKTNIVSEGKGRILAIVQVGDRVRKGQAIAMLDDTLIRNELAVRQAEAEVHAADLRYFTQEAQRLKQLYAKQNIALSELEKTQAERDNAKAQYAASQARIAQTEEDLRRMKILAPFDGVISERMVAPGEWLDIGRSLAVLTDTENLEINVAVPPEILDDVNLGEQLEIQINNKSEYASLRAIVPVAEKNSQLYELRLNVGKGVGYVNQLVKVGVPIALRRESIVIPEDALVIRNTGISVMVMTADRQVRRIPVAVGASTATGLVEVYAEQLKVGDQVIVRGAERLREGMLVVPVNLQAPGSRQPGNRPGKTP